MYETLFNCILLTSLIENIRNLTTRLCNISSRSFPSKCGRLNFFIMFSFSGFSEQREKPEHKTRFASEFVNFVVQLELRSINVNK